MELTNVAIQTVGAGETVVYDNIEVQPSCNISYISSAGTIILKGQSNRSRRYLVSFEGNVALPDGTTPVAPIELAFDVAGEQKRSTTMISTPTATEAFNNVSVSSYIVVPCGCCINVAVKNFSGVPIEVQNANLLAVRTA